MTGAVDTAKRIAASQPEAMLPCPVCAASLRAENLDRHLAKVHPGARSSQTWRGPERAVVRVLIAPPVTMGVLIAIIATQTRMTDSTMAVLGFGFVAASAPLSLAFLGAFKGRLDFAGDEIRLHYALGLLSRAVKLGQPIEVGSLPGIYVRIADDNTAITIRSRKGTGLRKHWDRAGWRPGKRRRSWDIRLERHEIVALEYELAARGFLAIPPS